MSKLRTLYGFDVDVEEVAHLIDAHALVDELGWPTFLQQMKNLNDDEYHLYLHAVVLTDVSPSHFGTRALERRVEYIDLALEINPKMQRELRSVARPRMQFLNHLANDPRLGPDAKCVAGEYSQFRIGARIPMAFFEAKPTFRLFAFTYVSVRVTERDRKLTAMVTPCPTPSYERKLVRKFGEPTRIPALLKKPVGLEGVREVGDPSEDGVDIAIITVIPEEYRAVRGRLDAWSRFVDPSHPNKYAWGIGEIRPSQGEAPYRVALAMSGRGAQAPAINCVTATIQRFRPRYVVLVGIAGGFPREGLRKGDVVLSQTICAYQYGALREGEFRPRHDYEYRPDDALWTSALSVGEEWSRGLRRRFGRLVRSIPGNVASGDILVDDRSVGFWKQVEAAWERLLAVEMEGAGAAHAVEAARSEQVIGFLMVRGISDMPPEDAGTRPQLDPRKRSGQEVEREEWKTLASDSAAEFVVHWIRDHWPLPPRGGGRVGTIPSETPSLP